MSNLLTVESIQTYIGQFHILEGVSLTVPQGSITALLGRNGAGKTTTLRSIMGLLAPREGRIVLDGQDIAGRAAYNIAALGVGYVPENRAIFRDLTVEENLKIAERRKGDLARHADLIFNLFPDLQRFYSLPGGQLSGGQQQMLAIARALMSEPRLLLLDEPSLGLAPLIIKDIFEAIRQLRHSGLTILLVEQMAKQALGDADRAYVLETGLITLEGSGKELLNDPKVKAAYLGAH